MKRSAFIAAALLQGLALSASGIAITGYTAAKNDRFASGFPLAPAPNSDPAFIGLGRDWSGVAWSTQTHSSANSYKGLAMLSPLHFLTAQHFEGGSNATTGVRVLGKDGQVYSATGVASVTNLGYGIGPLSLTNYDLALGTLGQPVTNPTNIFRNAVLDLYATSTSTTLSPYNGLPLLLYGRGASTNNSPRVGATATEAVFTLNNDLKQVVIRTTRTDIQLETGDSGSPALHSWTNPNGAAELTVLGVNSAVDTTYNWISSVAVAGAMDAVNATMTPQGHALRIVGTPSNTWVGSSTNINNRSAWGLSAPSIAPSDKFVLFDAATASSRSVNVNSAHNLRGLYFKSTATAGDSFTFSGTSVLTIGRGGVTNYDNSVQIFTAALKLGSHQFWDAGPGGIAVASLQTDGKLLELRATGASTISGDISGSGSLALESGSLALSGNSTFTGATWIHEGVLTVSGSIASSSSVSMRSAGILSGSGAVPLVQGAGTVSPGNGSAIFSAPAVSPGGGLDFAFEFTASLPQFGTPAASSNDLMRLTDPAPFASPLNASNRVALYLNVPKLVTGQQFRGGFFTNAAADFATAIGNANFEIYVADAAGSVAFGGQTYRLHTGPLPLTVTTETQSANFGAGTVEGRILQIEVGADPALYEGWSDSAFPEETPESERLPEGDPNGDGVINLLTYALALDPLRTPLDKLPQVSVEALAEGASEMVFQFRRNTTASDLTYKVLVSEGLIGWTEFVQAPTVVVPDPDGDGGAEVVEVRIPVAAGERHKFVRLQVSLTN